jgi:hypothetical protein
MQSTLASESHRHAAREFFVSAGRLIRGYTWFGTYPEACALVMGYDEGLGRGTITEGFQPWLVSRTGGERKVAFWVHVLRDTFPEKPDPDPRQLSPDEHDRAAHALFTMLVAYLDEPRTDEHEET